MGSLSSSSEESPQSPEERKIGRIASLTMAIFVIFNEIIINIIISIINTIKISLFHDSSDSLTATSQIISIDSSMTFVDAISFAFAWTFSIIQTSINRLMNFFLFPVFESGKMINLIAEISIFEKHNWLYRILFFFLILLISYYLTKLLNWTKLEKGYTRFILTLLKTYNVCIVFLFFLIFIVPILQLDTILLVLNNQIPKFLIYIFKSKIRILLFMFFLITLYGVVCLALGKYFEIIENKRINKK